VVGLCTEDPCSPGDLRAAPGPLPAEPDAVTCAEVQESVRKRVLGHLQELLSGVGLYCHLGIHARSGFLAPERSSLFPGRNRVLLVRNAS
jgi:hypothetical protein